MNDAPFSVRLFRTQALMQAEIIALRHQVIVLQRAQKIFSYLRTTTVEFQTRNH